MDLLENLFLLCGAIALFLYGLKLLSNGVATLSGESMKKFVRGATSSRCGAVLAGLVCTAVAQSSIATNMIVITFVEKGIISFFAASAVIMGTNIGTTVTAQLVSLSTVSDFEISAIGSLIAFIGFLFGLTKSKTKKAVGEAMLGFGFIFMGIELLTGAVECFKGYSWFTGLFLVENPLLLLLNGFIITAVLQSSSVVTSVMIVLASLDLLTFKSATFIILGANIGTCLPVIFASLSMSKESFKSAVFNIAFNIAGCLIFFFPLVYFGENISQIPLFSGTVGRAVANFHTFFNTIVCIVLLPMLKPFCLLIEKIVDWFLKDNKQSKRKKTFKGAIGQLTR